MRPKKVDDAALPHVWRTEEGHTCINGQCDKLYEILADSRPMYQALVRVVSALATLPHESPFFYRQESVEEFGFLLEAFMQLEELREQTFLLNVPNASLS